MSAPKITNFTKKGLSNSEAEALKAMEQGFKIPTNAVSIPVAPPASPYGSVVINFRKNRKDRKSRKDRKTRKNRKTRKGRK